MDQVSKEDSDARGRWPSTDAAFTLITPSYGWSFQRIDAANGRLQALVSVAATVTLGFPVIALSLLEQPQFNHPLFWVGLISFGTLFVVALEAKMNRQVIAIDLGELYDEWLSVPADQFKRDLLYFAADHVKRNTALVDKKHRAELSAGILLLVEVIFWILWTIEQY